jgi:hypothetical protein
MYLKENICIGMKIEIIMIRDNNWNIIQYVHGLSYTEEKKYIFNFSEKVTLDKMMCLFSGS